MQAARDPENPYASSSLYEPAAARLSAPLAAPIVARGSIAWPVRRQAFLLAYGVSGRDLLGLTLQALIMICFGFLAMAAQAWVPLVFMTPLFVFGLIYLAWRRRRALREAHDEQLRQGARVYERTIVNEGIMTLHGEGRELTPWAQYALARQDGELIVFIRRNPASFQAFVRSHFADQEDWQRFQDAIQAYVQQV